MATGDGEFIQHVYQQSIQTTTIGLNYGNDATLLFQPCLLLQQHPSYFADSNCVNLCFTFDEDAFVILHPIITGRLQSNGAGFGQ